MVVQTDNLFGLKSRFPRRVLSGECGALDGRVEQDVERFPWFPLTVSSPATVSLWKKAWLARRRSESSMPHVDRVALCGEGEAVFEAGLGLVVLDVSGFDLGVEEGGAAGDAVLFLCSGGRGRSALFVEEPSLVSEDCELGAILHAEFSEEAAEPAPVG